MEKKLVLVMRRDSKFLSSIEREAIRRVFPGCEITFQRVDPVDCVEHAATCRRHRPDMVMLPDEPVPSLAIQLGFLHCVVTKSGEVMALQPFTPQFALFIPGEAATEAPTDEPDLSEDLGSELIGWMQIAPEGFPCFQFAEHGKPEDDDPLVEVRVGETGARLVPMLTKVHELDDENGVVSLLSDIFLAGMRYAQRQAGKK